MTVTIYSNSSPKETELALQKLQKNARRKRQRNFDAFKYCGVITLKEDPLAIQKAMRGEWR